MHLNERIVSSGRLELVGSSGERQSSTGSDSPESRTEGNFTVNVGNSKLSYSYNKRLLVSMRSYAPHHTIDRDGFGDISAMDG